MPQRTATIESLPMAFEVVKAMQADGLEWGEGYRPLGRQALSEIIQGRMAEAVDSWLDSFDGLAMRDRRNGFYPRHLMTELGDIELRVPRTRHFCPTEVLKSYARRAPISTFSTRPCRQRGAVSRPAEVVPLERLLLLLQRSGRQSLGNLHMDWRRRRGISRSS